MMHEEHHDHRRGVADVVEGERLQVEIEVDRLRRGAGAALADHVDRVEGLQRVDGADDRGDDEERRDQRQRDVAEELPLASAVEPRRLVGLGRQRREPAEHDQHHQRRPVPDLDQHEARDHQRRRIDPERRRQADQRQEVVEHALLRVEHHRPDQRHRDRRRHHRHDEDAAQHAAERELAVEDQRGDRAEDERDDDREQR